jgi:hypothetical protein
MGPARIYPWRKVPVSRAVDRAGHTLYHQYGRI